MTIDYGRLVDAPKKEIAALTLWVGCGLSQFDVSRIHGGRGIRPESGSAHEVLRRQCWELYDRMLKAVPEPN